MSLNASSAPYHPDLTHRESVRLASLIEVPSSHLTLFPHVHTLRCDTRFYVNTSQNLIPFSPYTTYSTPVFAGS